MNIPSETKGRSGASFTGLYSGRPFYMPVKLTGAGCVTISPGTKQGLSHYL